MKNIRDNSELTRIFFTHGSPPVSQAKRCGQTGAAYLPARQGFEVTETPFLIISIKLYKLYLCISQIVFQLLF